MPRCAGWHSLKAKLADLGWGEPYAFFHKVTVSGSHVRSLELVAGGEADASAIDSNALASKLERDSSLAVRLRILESWGPLPVQPLLARASLEPELRAQIAARLLDLHRNERACRSLDNCRVSRFSPVDAAFYDWFPILRGLRRTLIMPRGMIVPVSRKRLA